MKKFTLLLSLFLAIITLQAQDYKISFAGTGASTTVGTVKVENLTQKKSLILNGSEVLHLLATSTGIDLIPQIENAIRIYPNPTTGNSTVEFVATASGLINIELFDISGKRVGTLQNTLVIGKHSYLVSGLRSGIYTVRITSLTYTYTGKLVSNGAPNSGVQISYIGNSVVPVTEKMLKSAKTEKTMQYNDGDVLKFTGSSGNYSTIVTDIPIQSKMLTFTFIACTDADGKNYQVVQIGTQFWMSENLNVTKYNDGTAIPNVANDNAWASLTTGGYCNYDNTESYATTYGRLYNWYAVNSAKLAPKGWHIPSKDEWSTLIAFLGGERIAGGKLKATGSSWAPPNTGATNETGFTGLPGGDRSRNGGFASDGGHYSVGEYGIWWSSTLTSSQNNAWHYVLSYDGSSLESSDSEYGTSINFLFGKSVRCIKDINIITVNTIPVSNITFNSVVLGGDITYDGGTTVTERGICYSTSKNPTISSNKIAMGNGVGIFTNTITGLTPNTIYYVRAYAKNSEVTNYGNEISFKTFTGTVTDIDGNVYNTVTIGTQVWTVENLKTTKFNDGTIIPNITDNTAWSILTTPGYCWYGNDVANKDNYGALYNWYVVNTGKLAPTGWHVPTDAEWTTLTTYLGGESVAGGKLKETGTSHWQSPNTGASNETEFTALPGGLRAIDGPFYTIGGRGNWWSSSEYSATIAWYQSFYYNYSSAFRYNNLVKGYGFSVRCIKGGIPSVSTTSVNSITATSAICGGNITNDFGTTITERGVCWNITGNPTLADNKTSDGTGKGSFTSNLTSLAGNTTYYIRAYATNGIVTGYGEQITFKTSAVFATVNTSDVTGRTCVSVVCGGDITNDGGATVTERGICYSTSQNPTIINSKMVMGSGKGVFNNDVTGLSPNTIYYIRAYATNSVGTSYGNEILLKTFTGTVTDIDGNVYFTVTIGNQVWMAENLKATKYNDGISIPNFTYDGSWDNLRTPGYCWYNNDITNKNVYGALYNWYTVNTGTLAPKGWHVPTDGEWTTLTTFLGGENVAGGKLKETSTSHWQSPNTGATNETGFTALPGGNGTTGGWWSSTENYTYNANAWYLSLGYDYSGAVRKWYYKSSGYSVRCVKDNLPVLSTTVAGNITSTSAIAGGNITNDWGVAVTVRGVCWNTSGNPTLTDNKTTDGNGTGSFASNLTSLTANTTYFVRAYATNSWGTAYGDQITFKTSAGLATVTTSTVTGITSISAICGGIITNDGGGNVYERGICYSTNQNPTISNRKMVMGIGIGTFTNTITGLETNTTYYVRAYATNSFGTVYGNQITFKTTDGLSIISTSVVTNITSNSAICGGNITSDGGAIITERGVCYGTSQKPTISNGKLAMGNGIGTFSNTVTGLTPNTTYYLRAYATNNIGTAYGSELSFKTYTAGSETVTDIDGNVYHTVTIGTQVWLVENLKTTKYKDGTSIPNVTNSTSWSNLSTPSYCWYNNDVANKNIYGALYNWYTIYTGKLCPIGWHVPTDSEWTTLTNYLGGASAAGGKLKEMGITHWNSPNTGATNETNFTALPSGTRSSSGLFQYIGDYSFWWSSTELGVNDVWERYMGYSYINVARSSDSKKYGFSVRCIKD